MSRAEMDYSQLLPTGERVVDVVDISHFPFDMEDIGSVVAQGSSQNDDAGSWVVARAGTGIKVRYK